MSVAPCWVGTANFPFYSCFSFTSKSEADYFTRAPGAYPVYLILPSMVYESFLCDVPSVVYKSFLCDVLNCCCCCSTGQAGSGTHRSISCAARLTGSLLRLGWTRWIMCWFLGSMSCGGAHLFICRLSLHEIIVPCRTKRRQS